MIQKSGATGAKRESDGARGEKEGRKEGRKEKLLGQRRGEEEHKRSESTKEHLSGLSALKEFVTWGTRNRH